ncbi:hypothetical protein Anas_12269 [Armadillidium nasatum]|uniref:Bestrophin homolog n=1 Tax=Armadillidium nasatum TaxID=96803 RepID=A0A5N5TAJ2_9CRUS|nr:hypothetical protein Anas_12269 [Armadillidium nasatum]
MNIILHAIALYVSGNDEKGRFISSEELNIFNMVPNKEFNTYWIPCTWFTALVKDARAQKRISDPVGLKLIMEVSFINKTKL